MFERRPCYNNSESPAKSKPFRFCACSQKSRATQAQAKTQVVCLPPGAPAAAGAAASQKQDSQMLADSRVVHDSSAT